MIYFVGVDIGTGSVRAALVTSDGKIIAVAANHPIKIFHPEPSYDEQSSNDIWNAVCYVVRVNMKILSFQTFKDQKIIENQFSKFLVSFRKKK